MLGLLLGLVGMAPSPSPPLIEVAFDPPTARSQLDVSLEFRESFHSSTAPARVDLLSHLPADRVTQVQAATVSRGDGDTFQATVSIPGHITPNTTFAYRFRVVGSDGSAAIGPEASVTVTDDRFTWKTLPGRIVRLHWYDGTDAFARRALDLGDKAIDQASALLGVTETEPVDFFIYGSEAPFRDALGPGTRENVGGEAIASIRTLFGLIGPSEIDSSWVDTLVTHELTHMVFNTAVQNAYHQPPRWLNEGLAVYLSQGYVNADKARVASAAASGDLIPLDAIAGVFPTTRDRFALAYAESVSAVDEIISAYGKPALVSLIRTYATGVTDEEAFKSAIGRGVAAFGDAWLAAQGAAVPRAFGPESPPPGPVPSDWVAAAAASDVPGAGGVPGASIAPGSSEAAAPGSSPVGVAAAGATMSPVLAINSEPVSGNSSIEPAILLALAAVVVGALVGVTVVFRTRRSGSRRGPPGAPPAAWPPSR
jgi:hypothetical protein